MTRQVAVNPKRRLILASLVVVWISGAVTVVARTERHGSEAALDDHERKKEEKQAEHEHKKQAEAAKAVSLLRKL